MTTEETIFEEPALLAPASGSGEGRSIAARRPGRPLEMSADEVLRAIRELSAQKEGLFRVHLTTPGLYARARRLFGSWSAAVRQAGVDYDTAQMSARARSVRNRNRRRATPV